MRPQSNTKPRISVTKFCQYCGTTFEHPHYAHRKYCSWECSGKSHSGKDNPAWKGGRHLNPQGYVRLWIDKRLILEHRYVMEQEIGRKLQPDEHIHHIDGDKTNNTLSNLMIISQAEHNRIHRNRALPSGKWATEFDVCIQCSRADSSYSGNGRCARCVSRNLRDLRRGGPPTPKHILRNGLLKPGQWSRKHDHCLECGLTEHPHVGNGLCSPCYFRNIHQKRRLN